MNWIRISLILNGSACISSVILIKSALNREDYFWLSIHLLLFIINYLMFYINSKNLK